MVKSVKDALFFISVRPLHNVSQNEAVRVITTGSSEEVSLSNLLAIVLEEKVAIVNKAWLVYNISIHQLVKSTSTMQRNLVKASVNYSQLAPLQGRMMLISHTLIMK